MTTEEAACAVCGKELAGRNDKKYCSDQCRAQLNNRKKKADAGELLILNLNWGTTPEPQHPEKFKPIG